MFLAKNFLFPPQREGQGTGEELKDYSGYGGLKMEFGPTSVILSPHAMIYNIAKKNLGNQQNIK
jgi:hypothetical protein